MTVGEKHRQPKVSGLSGSVTGRFTAPAGLWLLVCFCQGKRSCALTAAGCAPAGQGRVRGVKLAAWPREEVAAGPQDAEDALRTSLPDAQGTGEACRDPRAFIPAGLRSTPCPASPSALP